MKHKLLSILLHPLFIAAVISAVIIFFLPDYFKKYKVELVENSSIYEAQKVFFEDLNGDYKSEKIVIQINTSGKASFIIYTSSGDIIDQWNFPKKYTDSYRSVYFYDLDKNGYKEIYFVTQKNDSLFFNCIEPLYKNKPEEIFIDTIGNYADEYKIQSTRFMLDKEATKGETNILLNINSGHSLYPRNAYKINIANRTVVKSPYLTNHSNIKYFSDLDGDGINEMFFANGSSCNKIDSTITSRSDYSSWLMVLDKDLKFVFEPVEFKIPFSSINLIPIMNDQNENNILCRLNSRQKEFPSKLMIYSGQGKLIKEQILPKGTFRLLQSNHKREFILFNRNNGLVQTLTYDFKVLRSYHVAPQSMIYPVDIFNDGKPEWLQVSLDFNSTFIYQNDFKTPVEIEIPNIGNSNLHFGLKQVSKNTNQLYFRRGQNVYVYKYGENPLYIFRFLIYFAIFLLVFLLVWLIMKGQKIRMEKQIAIEKEISALQIKTLKNQVDPHFVFNAVNTISDMLLTDDKLEADRFISKFSKLMRETLKKSDKITTTLQDELDYVENYIQLQRTRFSDKFDYQIKKDLNIDYNTAVPNHVIYSYVENAIKHGLSGRKDGLLIITVASKDENIIITIENNGGGINRTHKTKRNSTGSGLMIMEKIYKLYEKLYHKKITHRLTEIKDKQGIITGIRVEIKITK